MSSLKWYRAFTPHTKPVHMVVLHCTDSDPSATVENIHQWHQARGWAGIGYHWVVTADGRVEKGRPEHAQGSGVRGHNNGVVHVCMVGRFDKAPPPEKQLNAACACLARVLMAHGLTVEAVRFHRELDGGKTCPGLAVGRAEVVERVSRKG